MNTLLIYCKDYCGQYIKYILLIYFNIFFKYWKIYNLNYYVFIEYTEIFWYFII